MILPMQSALLLPADDGGSGELPVVFLHSLAGNAPHWAAQLASLRPKRRGIALTLRGHQHAPAPPDGDYRIPALAADVAHTVDHLALGRFVLAGHSSGGAVALAYAAANPGRVAGLLLADPAGDPRQAPAEAAQSLLAALDSDAYATTVEDYYRSILKDAKPEVAAQVLADLKATPKATVVGMFHASMEFDPVAALRSYAGPRLAVIAPAFEAPFSLHQLAPELPIRRIQGTSHWLHMDKPDEFNPIMDEFLAAAG